MATPTSRGPLPEDIKKKAKKVSDRWHQGSTPHERSTAEGRLKVMALKHNWNFDAFLKACGLERPDNWTSARAA
jgi:hypothetical protein